MKHRIAILISIAVLLFSAVVPVFTSLGESQAAAQAVVTKADLQHAKFAFQNAATIIMTLPSGSTVTFTNPDIYNGSASGQTWYLPGDSHSSDTTNDTQAGLCVSDNGKGGFGGTTVAGINMDRDTGSSPGTNAGIPQSSPGVASATLNIGYLTGDNCTAVSLPISITAKDGSLTSFVWNGNSISTLPGTQYPTTLSAVASTNGQLYTGPNTNSAFCGGGASNVIVVLDSPPSQTNNTDNSGAWFCEVSPGGSSNGTGAQDTMIRKYLDNVSGIFSFPITVGGKYDTSPPAGAGGAAVNGSSTPPLSCNAGINPLNWLICGFVNGLVGIIGDVDNLITSLLSVGGGNSSADPSAIFCDNNTTKGKTGTAVENAVSACNDYYTAWSNFRDIALGLLVVIGLFVVITEALGMDVLDAYTVRKLLPRLVFATIVITLSWQLMQFFVELTNALGFGIRYLIYQPFTTLNSSINLNLGGSAAIGLATGAAITAMGIIGLLSFVATAALAVFVAFLVLVIRQLVIIMLIIFAPIAILAYILPNTQKVYKLWWDSFSKALFMFPLIVGLIAIGHVFAQVSLSTNGGGSTSPINSLIAFAAYFAPYFVLPFTLKFAGGALSNIGGAVHNAHRGAYGALSQFRKNQTAQKMQDIKAGKRWQGNPLADRASRTLQTASLAGYAIGGNPMRARSRIQSARSARISAMSGEAEKDEHVRAVLGNDDLLAAATTGNRTDNDARAYLRNLGQSGTELEQNVASIRQARRSMGREAFEDFAAANLAGTGTGYASGPAEMFDTINRVAGNDRARAARILNSARGQAERANRVDLAGAGFATSADQMSRLYRGNTNAASVNEVMTDEALDVKGAGQVAGARNNALTNMTGSVLRKVARSQAGVEEAQANLTAARATGNQPAIDTAQARLDNANHVHTRSLAQTAAMLDVAGQVSPENSRILGAVMGQRTNTEFRRAQATLDTARAAGGGVATPAQQAAIDAAQARVNQLAASSPTVGASIESLRADPEFQQYRREYAAAAAPGAAAAAAAAGATTPPGGGPPGGIPPVGTPLGP